ncbi:RHS repeat-associated core domain-containing protein [Sinomonas atrocyanea]
MVTPPGWSISLSASIGPKIALTATTNYDLYNSNTTVEIFDSAVAGSHHLIACYSGTTCTINTVPMYAGTSYVAYIAPGAPSNSYPRTDALATSDFVTPPPWTVSLAIVGANLVASTNYDGANATVYTEIFDMTKKQTYITYVGWCTSGTTCIKAVPAGTAGHMFLASAAPTLSNYYPQSTNPPPLATSSQVGTVGPTSVFETTGGANPSEQNMCFTCAGDPINTSNGEYFANYTDLSVHGRGPGIALGRGYSSQRAPYDSPFGYGWSFAYAMHLGFPASGAADITQENGSVDHFTQDSSGAGAAHSQVDASLAQNADGTWTFTRKATEAFDFDSAGNLLRIRDLNGYSTAVTRDAQGRVGAVTDASGRTLTFSYDGQNHITSAVDPLGRTVNYGYDGQGHLTSVTDPAGATTHYAYGSLNLLAKITDADGNATVNAYDVANRVSAQTDKDGNTTSFGYDGNGTTNTTTITSAGGRVTVETYSAGQRISVTKGSGSPQAATWTYAYDQTTFGLTKVTDPLGHITTAAYDAHGNKTSSTDANSHTTSWTYNALNETTTSTDALGVTTTYTYDSSGNPLSRSTPLTGTNQTATTTLAYGDNNHPGDVTGVTDPDGRTTTIAYDAAGNRTSITDPLGNTTSYTFDAIGRTLTSKTPRGNTTSYTFDADSRLTTVTDPLGKATGYGYDPTGLRTTVTDANNHTTTTAYDPMGRPTKVTNPDGTSTSTAYDADGNATSTTDANGHTTAYAYDPLNRMTSSTDPLNRATTYAYDTAGHLTGITNPAGKTTTDTYDPAGNKTGTTYSDGTTHAESYTYTADNQQAAMADASGTTTSTYDSLGRLTAQTNGNGQNVGYAYGLAGKLTGIAYPNGQSITRTYDAAGRLTGVTDWAGHTTAFTPDADGNTVGTSYANGVTAAVSFDAAGRLSGITDTGPGNTALASFGYTRNDVGNLTTTTVTGITAPNETYTYTPRDQLTGVNTGTYTYDPVGNPTALATGTTLSYDAASQPTTYTLGGAATNLTYDTQGNRTTGPGPNGTAAASYVWDQANRLTGASGSTATYDATGLRATRTPTGGTTAHYAWDTRGIVPLMLTDGTTSYLYDDAGNPVEQVDATGAVLYYQHDQYGSTRLLTDSAGAIAAAYTYDACGNLTAKTGTADTPLRWNGQTQDADTGLYYLRARYYDPQTAQFISVDPLAALTKAVYTYASNNPLNLADALGLWTSEGSVR